MKKNNLYPWQNKNWEQLSLSRVNNRTAHALLFTGPKGLGKYEFSLVFKNSLLCSENSLGELACGECRFCKMENHPDFHEVTYEFDEKTKKFSSSIKIDQIRALINFSLMHSHFGQAKVIVIYPAEAMTTSASNSLLKILEEPPQDTYFILISNEIHQLSATIKSRCQRIKFAIPDVEVSKQWLQSQSINIEIAISSLKLAFNAPITAKKLAGSNNIEQHFKFIQNILSIANMSEDPMIIANSWLKIESNLPLQALYSCLSDIILLKTVQNNTEIINTPNRDMLQKIANNVSYAGLYTILDKIALAKQQIQSHVTLLGIYEDILNLWQRLTTKVKLI